MVQKDGLKYAKGSVDRCLGVDDVEGKQTLLTEFKCLYGPIPRQIGTEENKETSAEIKDMEKRGRAHESRALARFIMII